MNRLLEGIARLHLLSGVLVALFLAMTIGEAASDGFTPNRDRYAASKPLNANAATRYILGLFSSPRGRKVLILDGGELAPFPAEGGNSSEELDELATKLGRAGMVVERSQGRPALPLLEQADLLVLACTLPDYLELDPSAVMAVMRSPLVLDNVGAWDSGRFDAVGLVYLNATRLFWPHWLDPEMAQFADYVDATVPEGDGILMVPAGPLTSTASRARWYLPLNVRLLPRRLYLWHPELGTSFVTTYYEWVERYNQEAPWRGTQRVRVPSRGLSKLVRSAPTRTLSASEKAAAQAHDVQWILFWRHSPDFLLADWELVPLDTVLAWDALPEQGGSR